MYDSKKMAAYCATSLKALPLAGRDRTGQGRAGGSERGVGVSKRPRG